ncbi:hypothetical protein [Streptomyces sp. E1N211]|uniref:hypothetical protein n=1 Tax=Streptomyces sp. E1N211 TaxID=1851876 RepID=UPI000EF66321|nr:hypothetical protein [Streptomyces sp. E1N211]
MTAPSGGPAPQRRPQRKQVLLRLDPAVYEALARWAGDELRSANAQIEFLLRRALAEAGRRPDETAHHEPDRGLLASTVLVLRQRPLSALSRTHNRKVCLFARNH